jgi:hypothetical protein
MLTGKPMNRIDAYRMVRRRTAGSRSSWAATCSAQPESPPTLRPAAPLENAPSLTTHESPRTTKFHNPNDDTVTLGEVERITIC